MNHKRNLMMISEVLSWYALHYDDPGIIPDEYKNKVLTTVSGRYAQDSKQLGKQIKKVMKTLGYESRAAAKEQTNEQ